MKPVIRLLFDNGELTAWRIQKGKPRQIGHFPATPAGTSEFSRFLSRQPASAHLLLLDHAEPRLITENLPATSFLTFRRMLDLRLGRLHPDTRWRCAFSLPATATSGRRAAFLALPESPALQDWLKCLASQSIRLRGIHCPPLLQASFIAHRHRLPARLLLISQHHRGIRLCLLDHGRPAALSLATPNSPDEIPEAIAHFSRCNPSPGDDESTHDSFCLLGSADWQESMALPWPTLRIVTGYANSSIDLLTLPAWRWPRSRFPGLPMPRQEHQRVARALWLAGATAGLGGLTLALASQSRQQVVNAEIERSRTRLLSFERQMQEVEASAAQLGVTAEQMQQLAGDRPALTVRATAFASSLQHLSAALDDTPGIELDTLLWTTPEVGAKTENNGQMQASGYWSPATPDTLPPALQQLSERLNRHPGIRAAGTASPGSQRFSLNLTATRQ